MANECIPLYRGGQPDLTGHTTAAVTGGRFLAISGNIQSGPGLVTDANGGNIQVAHAAAGAYSIGVAGYDAGSAKKVPILRKGNVVPMIADGAITAGNGIEVGATGKAKALASGVRVGTAFTTAADGAIVYVEL
jgi:hypothetical protein